MFVYSSLSTRFQDTNLHHNRIVFKDVNVQANVFHMSYKEWQSPAEYALLIQSDYLKKQRNSSEHVSGSSPGIFVFAEVINKKSSSDRNGKLWFVKRAPWRS